MKMEIFPGKGKMLEIFQRILKFFESRGKSETGGGMHHGIRGWTPLLPNTRIEQYGRLVYILFQSMVYAGWQWTVVNEGTFMDWESLDLESDGEGGLDELSIAPNETWMKIRQVGLSWYYVLHGYWHSISSFYELRSRVGLQQDVQ